MAAVLVDAGKDRFISDSWRAAWTVFARLPLQHAAVTGLPDPSDSAANERRRAMVDEPLAVDLLAGSVCDWH